MNALFREEQAFNATAVRAASRRAGHVGAFRGANYDAQAYYRPQLDCVMFTRDEVPFCRVCQRALEQVIDLYAGPRRTRVGIAPCRPSSTSRPCGTSPRRC